MTDFLHDSKTPNERGGDSLDRHVGNRLRQHRTLMGLSQEQVAKFLGVTFQQIQKYERGNNRLAASRLYQLAQLFKVPVDYFFNGFVGDAPSSSSVSGFAEGGQEQFESPVLADETSYMNRRETLELIRAYYRIKDEKQRKKIYDLVKSMGDVTYQDRG